MEWNQKETCDRINANLKKPKVVWDVEVTDTFNGESNYSWVNRYVVTVPPGVSPIRAAKAVAGWTGCKCVVDDYHDQMVVTPKSFHMVMFITPRRAEV